MCVCLIANDGICALRLGILTRAALARTARLVIGVSCNVVFAKSGCRFICARRVMMCVYVCIWLGMCE